jgi:hypothetical protein
MLSSGFGSFLFTALCSISPGMFGFELDACLGSQTPCSLRASFTFVVSAWASRRWTQAVNAICDAAIRSYLTLRSETPTISGANVPMTTQPHFQISWRLSHRLGSQNLNFRWASCGGRFRWTAVHIHRPRVMIHDESMLKDPRPSGAECHFAVRFAAASPNSACMAALSL